MKITGITKALIMGLVLAGPVLFSTDVRAGLTPTLQPTSPTGIGPFTFSYDVFLDATQKVNTGAVPGPSVTTTTGTPGTGFASFFTIYDFDGFVPGSNTQPGGWGFQNLVTGSTPSTTNPFDLVTINNLTWYWVGGDVPSPSPGNIVGVFTAQSNIGSNLVLHDFTSGATKNSPDDPLTDNTAIGTVGTVVAPGPNAVTPQIPEPATLLLLGSGLAGLAGWRQWRAKKA